MIQLPSALQIGDECIVTFFYESAKLHGGVHGVHFYEGKVKYDITLRGSENMETRIYNVDSAFVTLDQEWANAKKY